MEGGVGLRLRGGARAAVDERLVNVGGEEPWVGIPVHERVDLQLGVLERVRRGLLHLPVDDLPNPSVQAHLWRHARARQEDVLADANKQTGGKKSC